MFSTSSFPSKTLKQVAIFASGNGSNAKKIIRDFRQNDVAKVSLLVCNRPNAGAVTIAKNENVKVLLINKEKFFNQDGYVPEIKELGIDLIVLAGFLWKIPVFLIEAFPNRIINIHPALLPKFGGKGMYGLKVHGAVLAAGETVSGITIHYVDEQYDNGTVIFQATCPVLPTDQPETLADRIHALEHANYSRVIASVLEKL